LTNQQTKLAQNYYTVLLSRCEEKEIYSKRSRCFLERGQYKEALLDACSCVELDAAWPQGHFDKGSAEAAMFQLASAMSSFREVARLAPGHCAAWQRLQMLEELSKKHFSRSASKHDSLGRSSAQKNERKHSSADPAEIQPRSSTDRTEDWMQEQVKVRRQSPKSVLRIEFDDEMDLSWDDANDDWSPR